MPARRKLGLLTLVVACLFTVAWLRSFSVCDHISFSNGDNSYHLIISSPNWIGWVLVPCTEGPIPAAVRNQYGWRSADVDMFPFTNPFEMIYLRLKPIGSGWNGLHSSEPNLHLIVPYFLLIIPLTWLSAWLLLGKPRVKPQPTTKSP